MSYCGDLHEGDRVYVESNKFTDHQGDASIVEIDNGEVLPEYGYFARVKFTCYAWVPMSFLKSDA